MAQYKYYLQKTTYSDEKILVANALTHEVTLEEDVDHPFITVFCDRLKQKKYPRPKSDKYRNFNPIRREDFINYFDVAMDLLKSKRWNEEAEFYIETPFRDRIVVALFNDSKNSKYYINIEVNYSLDRYDLEVYYSNSLMQRRNFRKNATPITQQTFEYLYFETLRFLDDHLNYYENIESLIQTFKDAVNGHLPAELPTYKEFDLSPIINALNEQIREIEFRLMNNDTDRKASREKLRGRIEGIKRGISEVKRFASSIQN